MATPSCVVAFPLQKALRRNSYTGPGPLRATYGWNRRDHPVELVRGTLVSKRGWRMARPPRPGCWTHQAPRSLGWFAHPL